ncbi:hypothetical protein H2202_007317 [Exophiala xenobiotica]|nr:hypothetical protein H2202_007317 [Exophiala xenobiotica]KAK5226176.1 hypothetical protein LTR72_004080 [Exophiala xenobiotica]KAK5292195.1 hypothetical protein LTR14_005745 [Exophiala xenobiotica]KAK5329802.1 hypothetical protein LTR93_001390 [Exophiala xenobiotica]KAK5368813.1 hypothetical protein LTS13_007548 [Exophiala xenobiotica]
MPNPKIYLYAEALTNIRQLTLHASLQTEKNEHTKILISSDKNIITALHDGESSSIYLPTQISGTANVTFPTDKRTEFSVRLQIDDTSQLKGAHDEHGGIEAPWCASDLSQKTAIRCKSCNADIVHSGRVTSWKDLPSDHWAELMDLWFCHKPHEAHSTEDQAARSRGFSSKSKLTVTSGIGMVDTVSFLVLGDDCHKIQAIPSSRKESNIIRCGACTTVIGSSQEGEPSVRLHKSRLLVIPDQGQSPQGYDAAVFLSAQLLTLIESSVSRKVVIYGDNGDEAPPGRDGLLVWVFNPDIYYSSSKRGPTAHRAMKVFYKALPDPDEFLDANSNTHEELRIPEEDFVEFKDTLRESTEILPQAARAFQDWTVGLLDRWEMNATGSSKMDENPLNKKVEEGFEVFKLPAGMQELYL